MAIRLALIDCAARSPGQIATPVTRQTRSRAAESRKCSQRLAPSLQPPRSAVTPTAEPPPLNGLGAFATGIASGELSHRQRLLRRARGGAACAPGSPPRSPKKPRREVRALMEGLMAAAQRLQRTNRSSVLRWLGLSQKLSSWRPTKETPPERGQRDATAEGSSLDNATCDECFGAPHL